jgi:hypothetical protein
MVLSDYTIEVTRATFEQRLREANEVRRADRFMRAPVAYLIAVVSALITGN